MCVCVFPGGVAVTVSVQLPQKIRQCTAVVLVMMLGPLRHVGEVSLQLLADLITSLFIHSLTTQKKKKFLFSNAFLFFCSCRFSFFTFTAENSPLQTSTILGNFKKFASNKLKKENCQRRWGENLQNSS